MDLRWQPVAILRVFLWPCSIVYRGHYYVSDRRGKLSMEITLALCIPNKVSVSRPQPNPAEAYIKLRAFDVRSIVPDALVAKDW